MRIATLPLVLAALAIISPSSALAWGGHGHRIIGVAAMEALPEEIPAFLRDPTAISQIGELSREPDRSKGAGKIHDSNRDSAHFVDIDDAGLVMGGPRFEKPLAPTRADYEAQLQAAGTDSWKAGYLQYSIVDQYQQLTLDFAYWRVLVAAEARETDPGRRAWYAADRALREGLLKMTIGSLSHYVADGAQPLHTTVHYNGWNADYPNPKGYTTARIHGLFEGEFTRANVDLAELKAAMSPLRLCDCAIEDRTVDYILAGFAEVEPFYALEKAGGFAAADPRGVAFVLTRTSAGASELRDVIVEAWRDSADSQVGWRPVKVADVEAGRVDPFDALFSID
ncbi:MAG: S1/P1 Nuclease [Phenylobacterium sp.]|uniref:S1/P1 Nuclease n=1 Tax=Phenylobacterium sp. TaxID=1871053 RepID=UPI00273514AC|nr:S1/P1 Nuclease [Phenylobacterium sp.]MDP1642358.1 S1/P1 Nuclease [Phenylobacterium sp.]MDP3117506.1 S1/P1 Nuclease [Phenylobacterium sp.]MDP3383873.1 S1/P1 Nuclease [Phenylobacterium sp.]